MLHLLFFSFAIAGGGVVQRFPRAFLPLKEKRKKEIKKK